MLNWCEIGPIKTQRHDVLSQFLSSQNIPNQFTFIEANVSNLKEKMAEAQATKNAIRFHPQFFGKAFSYIENCRREFEHLKAIDSLIYDEKQGYWPEILFRNTLFEYLTFKIKNLDVMQKAFVVGECGLSRATISALIKLGFSKINIAGQDVESAENLISDFKKMYFNVEFEYTKRSDVTILPGTHGLVVNTFSALDTEDFPSEIYYFNFLKKGGLVIDLVEIPVETPFLRIAQDIGAQVVPGYEVLGFYDVIWVEKVTGQRVDFEAYKDFLKTHLENVPYDKNKLQKILDEFQI